MLIQDYLTAISQKYARTDVASGREMIYRTDFENLLKSIFQADGRVTQINHDSTSDNGNKPDFVISRNGVPVLYIEAKDIGVSLDKIEKGNQMERYFGYDNLILTDYVEFRFYRNGTRYGEPVIIATYDKNSRTITSLPQNYDLLSKTLLDFAGSHKEAIKSGKQLSRIMGGKAQRIRDNVREMLANPSDKYSDLVKMRSVVTESLVHGLDDESFADMYAQTLVYGLFAARYHDTSIENFSRTEARELVPKTNPFLRSFFDHIAGTSFPERLRYIVDELCEVFTHADIEKLLHDFYGKEKDNKDPTIHFYEDFLKEYDSKKKMEMGVFYTPRPVVQFIVRAVDSLLKSEFGLHKGLSDSAKVQIDAVEIDRKTGKEKKVKKEYHRVQVLDVATGTGTFLNEVINHVHASFAGQEGRWPAYVEHDLLPRLHGFELMMASYTIAHLKLGMTLHDTGANQINTRLGVYLTNTLDKPVDYSNQGTLFGFMDSIAEESKNASRIKSEYPIMCVIGNPPYSGISMNRDYTDNSVYKVEPGGYMKLQERKNWLDDDYVKFIRFGESLIEKNQEGIIGMITAHGYIDNPTFRGMRWHLRKTFDKIYVIDLHGNSNKKETSPDGSKDENVFDIKTGVSIILGVKHQGADKNKKLATVYQADLYGTRNSKYDRLDAGSIESLDWNQLPESSEVWRVEGAGKDEYMNGFSLSELFQKNTTGIVTMGDSFIIDADKDVLTKRVDEFLEHSIPESELKAKYSLGKNYAKWIVDNKKKIKNHHDKVVPIAYRPFDERYTYFDNNLVWRTRSEVMNNLFRKENLALLITKAVNDRSYNHVFVANKISESIFLSGTTATNAITMPIYLHNHDGSKTPSLNQVIWSQISEIAGETKPEDIFDYIYAYLHSPSYRAKYQEFLKTDFPRVPYPRSREQFWQLVPLGTRLRELHLMTAPECSDLITTFPLSGSDMVETLKYDNDNVYINDAQYFGGVPQVAWSFYIGGYQPAQKWLKDRKGKKLSNEDIEHYQKIIKILVETDKAMKVIDGHIA